MITEACLTLRSPLLRVERVDTFTLTFRSGAMAVLDVYNAPTFPAAMAVALDALPGCPYTVTPGDQTAGQSAVFYAWGYQGQQDAHNPSTAEEAAL